MNKKGFISTSIIYSFFLVFIAIVLSIVTMYSSRRLVLVEIKKDVRNNISPKLKDSIIKQAKENGYFYENMPNFSDYVNGIIGYDVESSDGSICWLDEREITWYSADAYNSTTKILDISDDNIVGVASPKDCANGTFSCNELIYYTGSRYEQVTLMNNKDRTDCQYVEAANVFTEITGLVIKNPGVYKTEDELGTSYYFRGDVKNNYVKFGTYSENGPVVGFPTDNDTQNKKVFDTMEACTSDSLYNKNCTYLYEENDPMYWRIVRINGDGTIRLIYDGTELVANGLYHVAIIGESAYNTTIDNKKYVGYTYNTSDTDTTQIDSTIKGYVDDWYESHLESNYGKYIADGIFCNDRTISSQTSSSITYEANKRLFTDQPSLMCSVEDRYSVNKSIGNGLLSKPVGLINVDEAYFAGGSYSETITGYYLNSGETYFTSSPDSIDLTYNDLFMLNINEDGLLVNKAKNANVAQGVRPVINLRSDVAFSGLGTIDSPYVIDTD